MPPGDHFLTSELLVGCLATPFRLSPIPLATYRYATNQDVSISVINLRSPLSILWQRSIHALHRL
jgi:hypothetical protein